MQHLRMILHFYSTFQHFFANVALLLWIVTFFNKCCIFTKNIVMLYKKPLHEISIASFTTYCCIRYQVDLMCNNV